ncbi:MAG: PAS domain S-box protein [Pyrinomonadaceae bacterium]
MIEFPNTNRESVPGSGTWQSALIDLSYEPIFVWDWKDGIIEWNAGAERLYGFERSEVLGENGHELLATKHPVSLRRFLKKLATDGYWIGEVRHTTKDGRELIVESRQQVMLQMAERSSSKATATLRSAAQGKGRSPC